MSHAQVERFRFRLDELVEQCQRAGLPMRQGLKVLLPEIRQALGARSVFVQVAKKRGSDSFFRDDATRSPRLSSLRKLSSLVRSGRGSSIDLPRFEGHAVPLDFAGLQIGVLGALFNRSGPPAAAVLRALNLFGEEIDDYIGIILLARRKQEALGNLSRALRNEVLETSVRLALGVLRESVGYSAFLLLRPERAPGRRGCVRPIIDGPEGLAELAARRGLYRRLIDSPEGDLPPGLRRGLAAAGLTPVFFERLEMGVRRSDLLGLVVLATDGRHLSTLERDIVEVFRDLLRLRLIDHEKERRRLLCTFSPAVADRLQATADYQRRYLRPRKAEIAVIFADLDAFTELSELLPPRRLMRLIERWVEASRRVIYRHGGLLDKVVGDCVIGLFGPPFFDEPPAGPCAAAVRAAAEIRDVSARMNLPVAVGIDAGPAAVGMMEGLDNYTGYGHTMNTAARLQDLASGGEILVSDGVHRLLRGNGEWRFSPAARRKLRGIRGARGFRRVF